MSNPLDRRLIALERTPAARDVDVRAYSTQAEADTDNRPPSSPNYAVGMAAGAIHDEEAVRQAIEEHQRRSGWMGPVLLVEPEMTEAEWLARFGRTD